MDIQHSQKSKDRWCKGYPSKHAKKMLKTNSQGLFIKHRNVSAFLVKVMSVVNKHYLTSVNDDI